MPLSYQEARAGRAIVRAALEEKLGQRVAVGVMPNPQGDGWAVSANVQDHPLGDADLPTKVFDIPVVIEVVGRMDALGSRKSGS